MSNEFLPAIVSVSILTAAFLFVWSSDVRRNRPEAAMEPIAEPIIDIEGDEQLSPE